MSPNSCADTTALSSCQLQGRAFPVVASYAACLNRTQKLKSITAVSCCCCCCSRCCVRRRATAGCQGAQAAGNTQSTTSRYMSRMEGVCRAVMAPWQASCNTPARMHCISTCPQHSPLPAQAPHQQQHKHERGPPCGCCHHTTPLSQHGAATTPQNAYQWLYCE